MEIKSQIVHVITYRPKGTRSPLGGTASLNDTPLLKFQKSLTLKKYSTFKFCSHP